MQSPAEPGRPDPLDVLVRADGREDRVRHVHRSGPVTGESAEWPCWADAALLQRWAELGVLRPWAHQAEAAEHARAGRHVVVSTGTASGKSIAYLLPALTTLQAPATSLRRPTVLYLAPTKALAADQLETLTRLDLQGVRPALYDGDTPAAERGWVRQHANYVLTNPDMLHFSMLPGHARWASFWRGLEVVVVDEMHRYRGVFGAQVAAVLRRLRRVAARYGSTPVFVLASATAADPGGTAHRLTGLQVEVVDRDTSRRGATELVLWEPSDGPDGRVPAGTEAATMLSDLVQAGVQTLAFVRSRRGAETVALRAGRLLDEVEVGLGDRVAAYRGGYLPEERRELEDSLRSGRLLGLASTNALELGIDISGLDAVLIAGWPGTRQGLGKVGL